MGHHYRDDWEWFDGDIDDGDQRFQRILDAIEAGTGPNPDDTLAAVRACLDNDLDAPCARDALDRLARAILAGNGDDPTSGAGLSKAAALLGIDVDVRPAQ